MSLQRWNTRLATASTTALAGVLIASIAPAVPAAADTVPAPEVRAVGQLLNGASVPSAFTADFLNTDGLTNVKFILDGVYLGEDHTAPYSWPIITAAGAHHLKVRADSATENGIKFESDFTVTGAADQAAADTYTSVASSTAATTDPNALDVVGQTLPGEAKLNGTSLADGVTLTYPDSNLSMSVSMPDSTTPLANSAADASSSGSFQNVGIAAAGTSLTNTNVAVQSIEDGVRFIAVAKDASAPKQTSFKLNVPADTQVVPASDGETGFDLIQPIKNDQGSTTDEDGDAYGTLTLGHLDAPWAKDANGKDVPTTYALDGATITQTVTPAADATYPLVSDPKWTWGWVSGTVYFNKSETTKMAYNAAFVAGMASFLPVPWNALAVAYASNIARVAGLSSAVHKCVKIKYPPFTPSTYSGGYCK
jgi:hypothetical protein